MCRFTPSYYRRPEGTDLLLGFDWISERKWSDRGTITFSYDMEGYRHMYRLLGHQLECAHYVL
jgi:hypothetical protein